MRPPANNPRDYGDPMTPMIDVVFNLLIFFVVTATGSPPEKLMPADLPQSGAIVSQVAPENRESWVTDVWLKLSVAGEQDALQVDMNGTVYQDLNQLKANLRSENMEIKRSPDGTPIYEGSLPWIQDHGMEHYLEKIRGITKEADERK